CAATWRISGGAAKKPSKPNTTRKISRPMTTRRVRRARATLPTAWRDDASDALLRLAILGRGSCGGKPAAVTKVRFARSIRPAPGRNIKCKGNVTHCPRHRVASRIAHSRAMRDPSDASATHLASDLQYDASRKAQTRYCRSIGGGAQLPSV